MTVLKGSLSDAQASYNLCTFPKIKRHRRLVLCVLRNRNAPVSGIADRHRGPGRPSERHQEIRTVILDGLKDRRRARIISFQNSLLGTRSSHMGTDRGASSELQNQVRIEGPCESHRAPHRTDSPGLPSQAVGERREVLSFVHLDIRCILPLHRLLPFGGPRPVCVAAWYCAR
jgi:hypothetical protein